MTIKKVRSGKVRHHAAQHLRAIELGEGMPSIPEMVAELENMTDILLGRREPPVNNGLLTMMETADAFYSRAAEMTMLLQRAEREGNITRGSGHYKFRTGELRSFLDMCKRAAELGSRRITFETLRLEAERTGRESRMDAYYSEDDDD